MVFDRRTLLTVALLFGLLRDFVSVASAAKVKPRWELSDIDEHHNAWTVWPTKLPVFHFDDTRREIDTTFYYRLAGGGIVPTSDGEVRKSVSVKVYHIDCLTEVEDHHIRVVKQDARMSDLSVVIGVDQQAIEGSVHFSETSDTTAEIAFCQKVQYNFIDPTDGEVIPEYTLLAKVNLHMLMSEKVIDGMRNWEPTEISVS